MLDLRYAVPGTSIVSEAFDGDIVVLDLDSGRYFSFTDSGCALWEALVEGIAPIALVGDGNVYTAEDVQKFLQELIEYRLLASVADPATLEVPDAMAAKLLQAKEKPAISVYDDLADLFLFDPIHDVEEQAGWPAVNKA